MKPNRMRDAVNQVDPTLLRPQIVLSGDEELVAEGYQKLLILRPERVVLELRGIIASIVGEGLKIESFGPGRVRLSGLIEQVILTEQPA